MHLPKSLLPSALLLAVLAPALTAQDAAPPPAPAATTPAPSTPAQPPGRGNRRGGPALQPNPQTDKPYQPAMLVPGGTILTLFPPDSHYLNSAKITIPEEYKGASATSVGSIISIHNPSIEFHAAPAENNTGTCIILAAGGGHNTLNVGSEAMAFVPYFAKFGISTAILRNRLRVDGYNPQTDEVYDAQQAIRLVRSHAKEWNRTQTGSASWAFPPGPSWPRRPPSRSATGTPKTTPPTTRLRASLPGRTSSATFIPVPRRSPRVAPRRHSSQHPARLHCLCRRGRRPARRVGRPVFLRDACRAHPQRRNAHLWRGCAPRLARQRGRALGRRPVAASGPSLWDLGCPFYGLAEGPRLPDSVRHRDQGGEGHRHSVANPPRMGGRGGGRRAGAPGAPGVPGAQRGPAAPGAAPAPGAAAAGAASAPATP